MLRAILLLALCQLGNFLLTAQPVPRFPALLPELGREYEVQVTDSTWLGVDTLWQVGVHTSRFIVFDTDGGNTDIQYTDPEGDLVYYRHRGVLLRFRFADSSLSYLSQTTSWNPLPALLPPFSLKGTPGSENRAISEYTAVEEKDSSGFYRGEHNNLSGSFRWALGADSVKRYRYTYENKALHIHTILQYRITPLTARQPFLTALSDTTFWSDDHLRYLHDSLRAHRPVYGGDTRREEWMQRSPYDFVTPQTLYFRRWTDSLGTTFDQVLQEDSLIALLFIRPGDEQSSHHLLVLEYFNARNPDKAIPFVLITTAEGTATLPDPVYRSRYYRLTEYERNRLGMSENILLILDASGKELLKSGNALFLYDELKNGF